MTRHPGAILLGTLFAVALLGAGLSSVRFDTHAERFLAPDHPARTRYETFKLDFGFDTAILLVLERDDVYDPVFLSALRDFHERVEEEVPFVDEVKSLANARLIEGDGDLLAVHDLLEVLPRTRAEATRLEERVRTTSAYRDHLVSSDARLTSVVVRLTPYPEPTQPLSAREAQLAVGTLRSLARESFSDEVEIHLTGNPVVNERLAGALKHDLGLFTGITIAAIALLLGLLFRRVYAVALPLVASIFSIIATFGLAGRLGLVLNVSTQILPPLLLAIGISAAIHLLTHFQRRFDAGRDRGEALEAALEHVGPAILVTSLTTAAGLGSFAIATDLTPMRMLGLLAPLGVGFVLVSTLAVLPALLIVFPIAAADGTRADAHVARLGRQLARIGLFGLARPRLVLGLSAAIAAIALAGVTRLDAANDALAYFPDGDPVRIDTRLFDASLSGSLSMEVLVDTGRPGGIHEPDVISALDRIAGEIPSLPGVQEARITRVFSIVDILRETHAALVDPARDRSARGPSALPDERALIAQELLLFEASGADDLARLVEPDYSRARVTLRGPWAPSQHYEMLVPRIEAELARRLPPGVSLSTTGLIPLFAEAVRAMSRAIAESYALALGLISVMMIFFIGSLRGGLVSMIPNVLPVLFTLGLMGWIGIDLDLFTMLIGSIAIGLAVDDTIHLFHTFRRLHEQHGDLERAVREGLETTGSAILTSSIVLSLGFTSFAFSSMANLVDFGLLTSLCIALALWVDVILLPPLLRWVLRADRPISVGRERPLAGSVARSIE